MALDTLLGWIAADYQRRAGEILAEAEEKAARIVEEGRLTAEEEFAFRWEEARRGREQAHRERVAKSRLAARMRVLTRRREILDAVFAAAPRRLAEDDPEAYRRHLAATVAAALVTGREVVTLNAGDREFSWAAVRAAAAAACARLGLPDEVSLSPEVGSFAGGAVLRDGARSVDLTIETLLALRRQELEVALGGRLAGGATR